MARIPRLNWTKSRGQFTATIEKRLYHFGTDRHEAEKQFHFLLAKHDMDEVINASPTFGEVADLWLDHVQQTHDAGRFRVCRDRVNEFLAYLGNDIRIKALRPHHVEGWIASKPG